MEKPQVIKKVESGQYDFISERDLVMEHKHETIQDVYDQILNKNIFDRFKNAN